MRKTLDGSRIERGRKNRRNIKKNVISDPATVAQTIRLRILLTGGSGVLSTRAGAAALAGAGEGAAVLAGGAEVAGSS